MSLTYTSQIDKIRFHTLSTEEIIIAESFNEPLTQSMLDAHHRTAGGISESAITRAKEIMGWVVVRSTEKMEA